MKKRQREQLLEPVEDDSDESPDEEDTRRPSEGESEGEEGGSEGSDGADEEGGGEGGEEEEEGEGEGALGSQVKDVPFEVLQQMRSDGTGVQRPSRPMGARHLKRENKNRPMEMPAKKPVPRFRQVIEAPKMIVRDPRFESLCGEYDEGRFKSAYQFLYTEQLPAELQRLKKLLKKDKDPKKREEHKRAMKSIERDLREEARRKQRTARESERRREERRAVEEGKRPFFLKKADKRKQDLIEKYNELKASGKLEAFLAKRRKKNAAKEHTKVPFRRGT